MIWLELLIGYGRAVDAVIAAARVWVPVLAGVGLGWWLWRASRRRKRGADTSGQGPDTPPDIPAGEGRGSALTCTDTCPDTSADVSAATMKRRTADAATQPLLTRQSPPAPDLA